MLEGSVLYTFLSQSIIVITTLAFSVKQASLEQCSLMWRSRILLLSRWAWLYILHLSKLTFPHLSNRKNIMCITLEIVFEIKWDDYLKGLVYCLCVCVCVCVQSLSCVWLWPVDYGCQAPLPMGFSRQEYWRGLPCPSSGDLPNPGIKLRSLASPALRHRGSPSILPGM